MVNRRRVLGLAGAGVGSVLLPRHVSAQGTPVSSPGESRTVEHARGDAVIPVDPQRIVALGDEFLLADMLALGIQPIASSATYADGFIGIDPADVDGFEMEPFTLFDMDMEAILLLQPDLIVVAEYVYDMNPDTANAVAQIVPVVVVETLNPDWQAYILQLASIFGKEDEAQTQFEALSEAVEAAAAELQIEGTTVSVMTIYPGAQTVAVWVSADFMPVDILQQLGAIIRPDATEYDVDGAGRAQISLEQLSVIDGEVMIMLQSSAAAEEQRTVEEITGSPLWQGLPAVEADQIYVLERVGYPGELSGRLQILDAYRDVFGS
ncbi:MAG: ABC transporter substrate-binding protein [Thermomicrobiales bacterium]|nr:ABC transporter substrate-binding protein [Thermomicrobiales bacterium]MCO5223485.1 ABC transporter substrate-binding protein [Thermomicrobiales bacterium]